MNKITTLLCIILCVTAWAQPPTDWQIEGLYGKVKKCISIGIYPETITITEDSEVSVEKEGRYKTVSIYNCDGYLIEETIYVARDFISDSDYVFLTKRVYDKYIGNKREMISYNEDGIPSVCSLSSWEMQGDGKIIECITTFRNAEKISFTLVK